MANDVLLAGSSTLLAVRLAARHLVATDDRVTLLARPDCGPDAAALRVAVEDAIAELGGDPAVRTPGRLSVREIRDAGAPPRDLRCDVLWLLTGDTGTAPLRDARLDAALARSLSAELPSFGTSTVNHVTQAEWLFTNGTDAAGRRTDTLVARCQSDIERNVMSTCAEGALSHRLFRTLCPVAPAVLPGAVPAGLHRFLAVLDSVLADVAARSERYLVDEPLHCLVTSKTSEDGAGSLRPLPMPVAARALLDLAGDPATAGRRYLLASRSRIPFSEFLSRVGDVYGVRLVPTDTPGRLTAVDRLLHARLTGFRPVFPALGAVTAGEATTRVDLGDDEHLSPMRQRTLLRGIRRSQRAPQTTTRAPAGPPSGFVTANAGSGLTYRHGGPDASPVVLLGAIGQNLRFWHPMLERLLPRHRVLFLEPSGPDETEAALAHAGVGRCHLVGWCTGPKAATAFALRRPDAVESLVFLNGSFKVAGRETELDTPYERNLEFLCRSLAAKPGSARRLMQLFGGDGDAHETYTSVLARPHSDLRDEVRAPFRSEVALTAYARDMLTFWSDEAVGADRVRAPVLAIGAEYDTVVSTARLRMAAARYPRARYVELLGATHQCLYDRAELLVQLMHEFWRDPGGDLELAAEIRV